jgi:polar amino acid transport system permease protein
MDALLDNFFNIEIFQQVLPFLLTGLVTTIGLSALVIPLGLIGGLVVALLATQNTNCAVRIMIAIYVDVFRALPPLVLLIFIYFGFPFLGIDLPKLLAVALGFMLNNSAYYGEIFRAGLVSVPHGQMEAAQSTGLNRMQALVYVIVPQAIRNVLPDLLSNSIEVVKLTTLASVVALPELLRVARDAQSLLYNPSPIVLAALIYLAILWPLVRLLSRLEHKNMVAR